MYWANIGSGNGLLPDQAIAGPEIDLRFLGFPVRPMSQEFIVSIHKKCFNNTPVQ